MEDLWRIYGGSMEDLWRIYGGSMEDLWRIYGGSYRHGLDDDLTLDLDLLGAQRVLHVILRYLQQQ
jgi:hypothetical protein